MSETIRLGELSIQLVRKDVAKVYLCVHPPLGRVSLTAPAHIRPEVARAYAITKLAWIRTQQAAFQAQRREAPRRYVSRESHQVWGRPHLLRLQWVEARPSVVLDPTHLHMSVRPGTPPEQRAKLIQAWQRGQLHAVVPGLIRKWEPTLGVQVRRYFLQRMSTRWGSCNDSLGHIRLNTELVKKPKDLLEYVIVHEMLHLIEPSHGARFVELLTQHWPQWRESRLELNALPL